MLPWQLNVNFRCYTHDNLNSNDHSPLGNKVAFFLEEKAAILDTLLSLCTGKVLSRLYIFGWGRGAVVVKACLPG